MTLPVPPPGHRPLVSVIMPTHNRATLLGRSMRSVLSQTYDHLELIVVDDASRDNTREVVESFADPRVKYIRQDPNRRAAAARNLALRHAQGELLAYQDDDDEWLIEKLDHQVRALMAAPPDVGLNLCGRFRLTATGVEYIGGEKYLKSMDFKRGFQSNFALIATPGWLVRRHFIEQAGGFDERMKSLDDWELALRLTDLCRFEQLDEPLYIQHRQRGANTGMAGNELLYSNDFRVLVEKHEKRWAPEVVSYHEFVVGRVELMYHSADEGRAWLKRALLRHPGNRKARTLLALSHLGRGPLRAAVLGRRRLGERMKRVLGMEVA